MRRALEPVIAPQGFDSQMGNGIISTFDERVVVSAVYMPLVAVTLMEYYVLAMQCVSTVAIVRRETNSWKWPVFQWLYMGALAWVLAFITYQGGKLLGLG